ncbi:hypothetical protein [Parvularcula sp. LCG005]|uniref:hypothetical protein n=1 Tax=Parvularcula sp. LCG005 TaxID=3078805 RepID=UPI002943F698|nr:hypothetical protein [Parvularcula sp. LCG005]WOI52559.1 hypothetical protein RUI03_10410 [Parvularcula sp. LCG005]
MKKSEPEFRRRYGRMLAESFVVQLPFIGPFLVGSFALTHPGIAEQAGRELQHELIGRVNDLESIVATVARYGRDFEPIVDMPQEASQVAIALAGDLTNATGEYFLYENLSELCPQFSGREMVELLGELEYRDLVTTDATIGQEIYSVSPCPLLLTSQDPLLFENRNVHRDAAKMAALLLEDQQYYLDVYGFQEAMGWPPRRINPALYVLKECIDERRWSGERVDDLATTDLMASPRDRAALRRFIRSVNSIDSHSSET